MKFEIAISASQGARRYQEDTAMFAAGGTGRTIAVLADGMGGHVGGAEASRIACETFLSVSRGDTDTQLSRETLLSALDAANRAIGAATEKAPENTGMGCTLIGAAFDDAGITWVSVGDSRLYLWRRKSLAVLNDDHSLAPELDRLAEAGVLSWDEALADPRRHYLRSALTGDEIELIDSPSTPVALGPGDVVVMASDGLDTLDNQAITGLVAECVSNSAAAVAEHLLSAVDKAAQPGQDNTTIVVVRVVA